LRDQADLLADRSETNKVTHLRRAPDREIISLQDDVALADTRALGRGARANLLDASALEVTACRRVIVHCRKVLDDQNLPTEDHRQLTRLLGEAEARLQDLASQAAMQN